MILSRRFYRLLPMALTLAVATTCGCANTGSYRAARMPFRKGTQTAAASQPSLSGTRPSRRPTATAASSPQQPPPMASTKWNRPTPSTGPGQTMPASPSSASAKAAPPTRPAGSSTQQAYYAQPAPTGAAAAGSAGSVKQMDYTVPTSRTNPFAAVAGRSAGAPTAPAVGAPATSTGGSPSAPYKWGAGTTGGSAGGSATTGGTGGQFLPPVRQ